MKNTWLIVIPLVFFFSCPFYFHPNCIRDISGKINLNKHLISSSQLKVLISDISYYDSTNSANYTDTCAIDNSGNFYKKDFYIQAEIACQNNCGDGVSLPSKVRVKLWEKVNNVILVDTNFSCNDYKFDKNTIILPEF